ncbi:ribosome-inactivating family protein [Streptomyces sp. NPDC001262]|uniref:ribosome-inactivating family protein n=1 Tax=unclassified Streptomyces TaxID=2593676 RepID=UPI00368C8862
MGALIVAFAISLGLVGLTGTTAQADPGSNWTKIDWDITGLENGGGNAASNYYNMVNALHNTAGHHYVNSVDETTGDGARLIEIRVNENRQQVMSLYLWADNLYFAGYWVPNGGHYAFSGVWPQEMTRILGEGVNLLPWDGNYATMPGGGATDRAGYSFSGPGARDALRRLQNTTSYLNNGGNRGQLSIGLIQTIAMTSEAARFGRIYDTVYNAINARGTAQMGPDNVELENNWDRISRWIYQQMNNLGGGVLQVAGRQFTTMSGFIAFARYIMMHNHQKV